MGLSKELYKIREGKELLKWLIDADLTYCSGRYLIISEDFFFRTSGGYLLHQAAEKYLKVLRKILRPQIAIEKHRHKLIKILNEIKDKLYSKSIINKLEKSLKKIEFLEKFRYVDQGAKKDTKIMEDGLKAIDYLVMCIRKEIEDERPDITETALKRYIEGLRDNDKVLELIIDCLLNKNYYSCYWIKHLKEINEKIDMALKKHENSSPDSE